MKLPLTYLMYFVIIQELNEIGAGDFSQPTEFRTSIIIPSTPLAPIVVQVNASFLCIFFMKRKIILVFINEHFDKTKDVVWQEPFNGGSTIHNYSLQIEYNDNVLLIVCCTTRQYFEN